MVKSVEMEKDKTLTVFHKTWLLLNDLAHQSLQKNGEKKSLKELVHEAVETYAKKKV